MTSDLGKLRLDRMFSGRMPGRRLKTAYSPLDCYLPLIQKLFELREEQAGGVIAGFTSVSRGEGVTHVVESLGRKLAEHTWEQVLLTTAADLTSAASARFDEGSEQVPQVCRLVGPRGASILPAAGRWDGLQELRDRFGFVLVDCPAMRTAMRTSPAILNVLTYCDAVALVVAAGEVRRSEIDNARKMLQASSVKVIGTVLNKQVDPVPPFISRLF